jgi:hypothetical protein
MQLVAAVLLDIAVLVVVIAALGQPLADHGMDRLEVEVQAVEVDKGHMDYRGVLLAEVG